MGYINRYSHNILYRYIWSNINSYHINQCDIARTISYTTNKTNSSHAQLSDGTGKIDGIYRPQHIMLNNKPDSLTSTEITELINNVPINNIRNFSIIAHIDHGKSTLSDRLLEYCSMINPLDKSSSQILDNLQVERERGITVRAQCATMYYKYMNQSYYFNLIDTPGHVDFTYEVSRSLAACNGALLIVDASQGIQAQTLANYYIAKEAGLDIVPVLTKIDLPHSNIELTKQQLHTAFNIDPSHMLCVSSKSGENIDTILPAIIQHISPPTGRSTAPLRALLFDCWYSTHRGVICLIHIVDGYLQKGDRIKTYHSNVSYEIHEIGIMQPDMLPCQYLRAGQVGYIIAGIKTTREVRIGDTFYKIQHKKGTIPLQSCIAADSPSSYYTPAAPSIAYCVCSDKSLITPLPGFKASKPMVWAGLYPAAQHDFDSLSNAIEKLCLNDTSVHIEKESSSALGLGYRCGFLGILHMDVFNSRLQQEYNVSCIVTAPTVSYHAVTHTGELIKIDSPSKYIPVSATIVQYLEPMVIASIILPTDSMGSIIELCNQHRGVQLDMIQLTTTRILLKYQLPLSEIVNNFYDSIKSITAGYASLDYELTEFQHVDLVALECKINGEAVDALSLLCERSKSVELGRKLVTKLSTVIDRQAYEVIIQSCIGNKVIARERIAPYRKDVLIKGGKTVGGGDITRKNKLLQKQKEGKKRMKSVGNIELNENVFASVMKIK